MVLFPEHYQSLHRRVEELSKQWPIKTVLDLGCGPGYYVGFLSVTGYDSHRVDIEDKFLPEFRDRLRQGDLTMLRDIFGDKLFDLIVSNNSLTIDPILFGMLGGSTNPQLGLLNLRMLEHLPDEFWKARASAREKIETILGSAFTQLNPGGLLVSCEKLGPNDKIDFSREAAERIGYKVLIYEHREAVLQKPK